MTETAKCRGCGRALDGEPYHQGGRALHPITRKQCKVNFYGGFVCSPTCDRRASLDLESTMPGHAPTQRNLSCCAEQSYRNNWSDQ